MGYQRPVVTEDNRGPLVEFAAYLLITCSALTTLIKVVTKVTVARSLQSDDWFSLASLIFAAGQCVAIIQQVHGGLGQRTAALTGDQIVQFQKAEYSVELLYVLSIACAKMITLRFMATLAIDKSRRSGLGVLIVSNAVWLLVAVLGVAFQCGGQLAWEVSFGQCFYRPAFWTVISTFDILIDIAVSILPVYVLYNVQVSRAKRMNAMVAFAGRILVVPPTALRLNYIYSSYNSADPTFDDFNTILATEIATNFSIIFACISFIKPFLDNIETGRLASKIRQQTGNATSRKGYVALRHAKTVFQPVREPQNQQPPMLDSVLTPSNAGQYEMLDLAKEMPGSAAPSSQA